MTDKAVLLSDIEFVEMHSDDWERIERESFEIQKQPQLNENQQVVLDWAKSYLSEAKNIMWFIEELAFLSTTGGKMRYKQVAYTYESLSDKERRALLSAVMAWAQKQEAE